MYSRIPRQPPKVWGEPSYRRQDAGRIQPPPNYSGSVFPLSPPPAEPEERMSSDLSSDMSPDMSPDRAPDAVPASDMLHADPWQRNQLPRNELPRNILSAGMVPPSGRLPLSEAAFPMMGIRPDARGRDTDMQEEPDSVRSPDSDRSPDTDRSPDSSENADAEREAMTEAMAEATADATAEAMASATEKMTSARGLEGPRPLFQSTHFPLGHGLGQEELWILGLVLLLLHEDSSAGDHDHNDLWETLLLLGVLLLCG